MKLTTGIIDRKISLEYLLKLFSNFEKLKMIVLNKEQLSTFNTIPNFKIETHLEQLL